MDRSFRWVSDRWRRWGPVLLAGLVLLPLWVNPLGGEGRAASLPGGPGRSGAGSAPVTFRLVPAESRFRVRVAKAGALRFLAHDHTMGVQSFRGEVTVAEDRYEEARLELDVDAPSIVVLDEKIGEGDRAKITRSMHEEVLQSARYPIIRFRSREVRLRPSRQDRQVEVEVTGSLTLRGVTREIRLPVTVTRTPRELRAVGSYPLTQTEFGIAPYSTAGGTIRVKDVVVLEYQLVARI
jgi:polyisoprenoid-binding protein YceI